MKARLRSPSLFLTFALSFLAVLLLGIVLQGVLFVALINPLLSHLDATRAGLLAGQAAREIGLRHDELDDEGLRQILRRNEDEMRGLLLVYRDENGRLIAGRRLPPMLERLLQSRLTGEEPVGDLPPPPGPGRGRGQGRREEFGRLRIVHREEVRAGDARVGEVASMLPPRRWRDLPQTTPRSILFFLPLAILLAGAAGLVVFRLLLRRLHALETLATRLSEGDLDARIEDPGPDELGRLGARLNDMAARLAEARRLLDANDRQRRQLLADVSHELATPLTSIRGYTEMLLNPSLSADPRQRATYLENVLQETARMDGLVQDILELSRLEAGAAALAPERLDWAALCRNTVHRFEPQFRESGLRLEWTGTSGEVWIEADGRRMEQVIENLLSNALRYVPRDGSVTVGVLALDATTSRLEVTDDGPGFPEADLPHVFDRFYRGDTSRSTAGSGLGLAIVREIVAQHGGTVRARNRAPRGASIEVDLPPAPG
jgi:signal transduction histidine kinase